MGVSSGHANLPGIKTRLNARASVSVAMSILLCAGIAGCAAGPGAFELSSPASGTTSLSLTPTLTWTDAVGETSYIVEIDEESTFSPPLTHQDTEIAADTTSFVVPGGVLAGNTTYYWRVTAANSAGSTTASNAPFSFRVLSSGELVPGFGTGGVVTSNPGTDARGIAIDSAAMYVVGFDDSPGDPQWRIEKRSLTDGSLVPAFGAGGVVTSNPSNGADSAYAIAIDSTAMYVIGDDDSPGNSQWRIEKRSLTDGSLVLAFGTGGVVTSNPSNGSDRARGIAIDSTATYVVGSDNSTGNSQWRIEKRSLADGSLDPAFGTGGVVITNPSNGSDSADAIAIDSTAMYVVGDDDSPGNRQWRIEKRSLTDGSLVPAFGTGGVATSNPSADGDYVRAIAIDSTAMYVVGFDNSPGNTRWRIEKRNLTDGSLVPAFGTGGVVTINPSAGSDWISGIAIDFSVMYVAGCDESSGNVQWRIEKRSLTDGSLIPSFGTGGAVTSNPGTGVRLAFGIAMDTTAIYVVGTDANSAGVQSRIEKRVK